jgi:ATP-dependent DNA helicase RecG
MGIENEGGQKGGQKKLGESRSRVLSLMAESPAITRRELSDELGLAESAIEKHVAALKTEGLISRVGGRKTGHWQVADL